MIAGRASATALLVALSVRRHGARFALPELALRLADQGLRQAGGAWRWLRICAATPLGGWLLDRVEALLLPGLAAHHCRRKQWLWQQLRASQRMQNWIWLGAGLDGLGRALRVERPEISLIELDHPDSLTRLRAPLPSIAEQLDVLMLPLRLPEQTAALLKLCADKPCAVVAEGLLMYLAPRPLLRLLRALSRLSTPPELWISALAPVAPLGRGFARRDRLTHGWLQARGEPFRWRIEPDRLQALLRRHGYVTSQLWGGEGYGEFLLQAQPAQV